MASAARSTIKETMSEKTPETEMVNVELLCDSKRITDIIMYIDFVQIEAVIDTLKPRRLLSYFVDDKGSKISYDVPIIVNSTEKASKQRLIHEKFVLTKSSHNRSKNDYLVMVDMENPTKEYRKYKFELDTITI